MASAALSLQNRPTPPGKPKRLAPPPSFARDNAAWANANPEISVIVPAHRDDPSPLIHELCAQPGADRIEIIVYDDGSLDPNLTERLHDLAERVQAPVRIVTAAIGIGRARARNALLPHVRSQWVLMLDSDMIPADDDFLKRYFEILEGAPPASLFIGGQTMSLQSIDPKFSLNSWLFRQSRGLDASIRSRAPRMNVSACNVLTHRDVLVACRFDEFFRGWGWEDIDWGLRAACAYPVVHIDNPALHLRLMHDASLMIRQRKSAANFARLVAWHPNALGKAPLVRAAQLARRLPFRTPIMNGLAQVTLTQSLPLWVRGQAFKAWRALVFAEHL